MLKEGVQALPLDSELFSMFEDIARLKREVEAAVRINSLAHSTEIANVRHDIDERLNRDLGRIEAHLAALANTRVGAAATEGTIPNLEILDPVFRSSPFDATAHPVRHNRHLIMPIHPPKIIHLSSVFDRLRDMAPTGNVLWTLVATSPDERATIENYISVMKPFIPVDYEIVSAIELCDILSFTYLRDDLARNSNGGIINVKKIIAIYRALSLGAEEICCVDSDVMFLREPAAMFDAAKANYQKRVFFAAACPNDNIREILRATSDYMLPADTAIIRSIMGESRFSWFFDAPYYPAVECRQFFAYIQYRHGGLESALRMLSWHSFDHILFINFLIRHGAFRIVDVNSLVQPGSIIDELTMEEIERIAEVHDYVPVWAPLRSLLEANGQIKASSFTLAFHVDRIKPSI